jgi:hypothetical protein
VVTAESARTRPGVIMIAPHMDKTIADKANIRAKT